MVSEAKCTYSLICVSIFTTAILIYSFPTKFQSISSIMETINIAHLPTLPEEIKSVLKNRSYVNNFVNFSLFHVAKGVPGSDEPQINQIFLHLMKRSPCALNKSLTFIVDVGLNVGYFSLLSSTYKCFHVLSLDPQLRCHQLYRFSRSKNKFKNKWNSYHNAAWFKPAQLTSQRNICDPGYSLNVKDEIVPQDNEIDTVQSISIDLLPELKTHPSTRILIMKIDTEGAEIGVLLGCRKLIEDNRIDNFIIEVMNHQWSWLMSKDFTNFEEIGIKVLTDLQKNYTAILLYDLEFSSEIIAWSLSSPVPKPNPIKGFSAVIPEGTKGFPVLLESRKNLTRACNIWFRRKT